MCCQQAINNTMSRAMGVILPIVLELHRLQAVDQKAYCTIPGAGHDDIITFHDMP